MISTRLVIELDALGGHVDLAALVATTLALVLGLCEALALGNDQSLVSLLCVIVRHESVALEARVDDLILGDAAEGDVLLLCALDVRLSCGDGDLLGLGE